MKFFKQNIFGKEMFLHNDTLPKEKIVLVINKMGIFTSKLF